MKEAGTMSKRAILYARVSYDDRDTEGRNLQGQIEMCREYAGRKDYEVAAELAEDERGASGASLDLPKLNQIRDMARAGAFDVLVVRELDRLSRSLAKQLIVEKELKQAGVQIDYVLGEYLDTPEGQLNKNVKAVIAEYERLKIAERLARGRRLKVKAGSIAVSGHSPFGYRLVQKDGKNFLEIDEGEAEVVRLIFGLYTGGDGEGGPVSIHSIACRLTALGIPTCADTAKHLAIRQKRKGWAEWTMSAVGHILRNETYAGVWHYGKRAGRDGRRNSDDHLLAIEVPAVVDRETWEIAQGRLVQNKQDLRRESQWEYLLSRRAFCGECGRKMRNVSSWRGRYRYYLCGSAGNIDYAQPCKAERFRADRVDHLVWAWVKSFLTNPATLAQGLNEYQAERKKVNAPLLERLRAVDNLLAGNKAQLRRLLDLYLAGDFPKEMLTERKARLEVTIEAFQKERDNLAATVEAQTVTQEQMQTLQDFAADVAEGLEAAEADFQTRRCIIEALDVQATLAVEDGQKVVYVRCVLGKKLLPIDHHRSC
jgi:site-specific DNA recombinase